MTMTESFIDGLLDLLPDTPERERYREYIHAAADAGVARVIGGMIDEGMLPADAMPFAERIQPRPILGPAPPCPFPPVMQDKLADMWQRLLNGEPPASASAEVEV
jgi:hypothetical protein